MQTQAGGPTSGLLPIAAVLAFIVHPVGAQTTQPTPPESSSSKTSGHPFDRSTLTGDWGGLRPTLQDLGLTLSLSYQQQYQQNFRGGLDTHNGHRLSGSYDFVTRLDFQKMRLIDNAGFYLKAKGTWSDGINDDKVGALFNVNSDAGGDHPVFVRKWWYWHKFLRDRVKLRLGMIETNKDLFDISLYANHEDKDFLNRLSIRNPTIPHRTGIGAFLKIEPMDSIYFQVAAVDAQSRNRRTGFNTAFHNQAWFIGLWECGFTPQWASPKGPMPGRYRMGFWLDPRPQRIFDASQRDPDLPENWRGNNLGLYVGLDQMVWKENNDPEDQQGLGLFARYGHAKRDVNQVSDSWSVGISYKGLLPTRDKDVTAFGVSQAILSDLFREYVNNRADRETVYEWYYKLYLTPWLSVTPDLQIVTNPGGDKDDRDSIIGGIRIRVIF